MSKLTAKAEKSNIRLWHAEASLVLTPEESRALRAELEQAEKEAGKRSAFREWWVTNTPAGDWAPGERIGAEAWNAAIDAALACLDKPHVEQWIYQLKEPTE